MDNKVFDITIIYRLNNSTDMLDICKVYGKEMFVSGFLFCLYKGRSKAAQMKEYSVKNYISHNPDIFIFKASNIEGMSDNDIRFFVKAISAIDGIIDVNITEKNNVTKPAKNNFIMDRFMKVV